MAGHHPVLSAGAHGNTQYLESKLKPLLEENDVTAYLSGHDHNLQVSNASHTAMLAESGVYLRKCLKKKKKSRYCNVMSVFFHCK